jgi:hypothetical protein
VDILQSYFENGVHWIYANITVSGVSASTGKLDASYAIEIDPNRNGHGVYLILVN